jgi:F-type H+-transporting ATPase subunit gamma
MSRRRDVERRIEALGEIHGIMESMKNLALMESRKLARCHDRQQRVVESISRALNDMRRHYAPDEPPADGAPVYLLLGAGLLRGLQRAAARVAGAAARP